MLSFDQLWKEFPFSYSGEIPELLISGIVADNRQVQPGFVFVAIEGFTVDGHKFIPDAIERGAVALVGSKEITRIDIPYVRVENPRQALAYLAAAFYGYPARRLTMIGVTGTDGKTTTVNLIFEILKAAGIKVGMISTVNAVIGETILDTGFHVTTPEAPDIQRYLAQMVDAGITHCVLETTSHGWAQYRVDACEFDIGVITNITHEHLDQHGTFENYRSAKARLFISLESTRPKKDGILRIAILNKDDNSFSYLDNLLSQYPHISRMSYSLEKAAEFTASDIRFESSGLDFMVGYNGHNFPVHSNLIGKYNVANCLAALSATVGALEIPSEIASKGIASLEAVPGRMEIISLGQSFTAIVDFAHTPNALKQVLETAREMTHNRVIAVFGSAGLRDRQKRRLMAQISINLADITILTAEDPRTDSLEAILDEMSVAVQEEGGIEGNSFFTIPDRGQAIRKAVSIAHLGDIVMVCGKGHEQSMCFGSVEYPWDDRIALKAALAELLRQPGPQMPRLPTS